MSDENNERIVKLEENVQGLSLQFLSLQISLLALENVFFEWASDRYPDPGDRQTAMEQLREATRNKFEEVLTSLEDLDPAVAADLATLNRHRLGWIDHFQDEDESSAG